MSVEGFNIQPMVRLHLRHKMNDRIMEELFRFEMDNGIAGRTFRGGYGSPVEKVTFYTVEDAALVAEFLKSRGIMEMSEGRLNWDRLDAVQKQAVLEDENAVQEPTE